MKRRKFIKAAGLVGSGLSATQIIACTSSKKAVKPANTSDTAQKPFVVSTWNPQAANQAAWEILKHGGYALDAIEAGIKVEEADPKDRTVGYGGNPDREGRVTLDACVMNEKGNAGSVVFMEDIKHPVSVARKVMEDTPHVILAGEGATQFAVESGFEKIDLLTPESEKAWQEWLKESDYKPKINIEMHDTIGMIGMDSEGRICGGCSTSGLSYKMRGRVGDSPIIGSGLFVDNEIGAAVATGLGEEVLKTVGTFLIVELMRQGASPQAACEEAISRIVKKNGGQKPDFQVAYIAFDRKGNIGAYCIHPGFGYVLHHKERDGGFTKSRSYFVD